MLTSLGLACFWFLVPGVIGVISEIVIGGWRFLLIMLLGSVWSLHPSNAITVMKRWRVIHNLFLSIDFLDMFIYQWSIVLQAKLSVITNWWLNDLLTLYFFFRIAECCKICASKYLWSSWSLFRVNLKHSKD